MYWCNLDKPIKILKECSKDTIYAIEMSDAKKLKHSNNILDLIEVGDIVNGYRVTDKYLFAGEKPVLETEGNDMNCKCLCGKDIKTILTKEQYEANCYKVKEEIC